jgi:hypothetical protein
VCTGLGVWCVQDWRCDANRTGGVVCTGLEVCVYKTGGVMCTGLEVWCVQDWGCGVYRTGGVVCTGLEV